MSKNKVFWFWHYEDETGTVHTTTDQKEAERALHERPLRTIWAERMIETDTTPAEEIPVETVKERRYKRGERGLETMEKRFLVSNKMKRFVKKMSSVYSVEFITPKFVPVFASSRMKTADGYHYSDKITIDKNCLHTKFYLRTLLWHEIIHSFVHDNYYIVHNEYALQKKEVPSVKSFEKDAFRYACNDGSHDSQNWKLLCECGMWSKTVQKKNSWHCPRCKVLLVSKNEYGKLKKIASLKSSIKQTDINHYKPWKSNERIQ